MDLGTRIGHYRITDRLGAGGMGEVYLAEDSRLRREVAIKVLPPDLSTDPDRLTRLEREAQLLAQLEHPNIAAVYGLEEAEGIRFLVMQLAEGRTLAERISQGPLPLEEALHIALQVATGLEAAHQKGIVHRDLKPGNIQIAPDGRTKLLDFGLAKALSSEPVSRGLELSDSPTVVEATRAGMILGTAGYMSPEQARGQSLDHRADIWAFGCVLYEMLTGEKAFPGETVTDVLGGIVRGDPDWEKLPADTPRRIRALLRRCLRKDVGRRIQAIGDARVSIEEHLEDPVAAESILDNVAGGASSAKSNLLPWALSALLVVLLAIMFWYPRSQPAERALHLKVELSESRIDAGIGPGFSLSPDGSRIVYAVLSPDGNTETIHLRAMNRLESLELTSGGSNNGPYNPFFSPDGEWVGFVTPTEIKKVSVTGGTPIRLADVGRSRGASWGPNGAIVFAPRPNSGLYVVSDQGGEVRELTVLDPERKEATHRWPFFLPNGKAVLFTTSGATAGTFDQATIEAVTLATGERRVVHRGGTNPIYLPTGHLLFANEGTIFGVPFDQERLEETGNAVPLLHDVSMNEEGSAQLTTSLVGLVAYLTGRAAIPEYPVLKVDRRGEASVLWAEKGAYGNPRLSPDGKKMSLSVVREGNVDVWVYDLERTVATRLTFDPGYDGDAVWSPDGEELIYSSSRTGRFDLYRKPADGSATEQQVTESNREKYPLSWSPDGRSVVTYELSRSNDLVVVELDDPQNAQVFVGDPEFAEQDASFSPDGNWIAYSSNESGRWEVYVRPYPPGGGKWQVSDGGGGWPRWSKDGQELFYRTEDGLMVAEIETGAGRFRASRPEVVFRGGYRGGPQGLSLGSYRFADYDVFPDGLGFVMFPADEDGSGLGGHILLVTNWFDDVRRAFLSPSGSSERR